MHPFLTPDDIGDYADMLDELHEWRRTHLETDEKCIFLALAKTAFWQAKLMGWNSQQIRQIMSRLVNYWTKEEAKTEGN